MLNYKQVLAEFAKTSYRSIDGATPSAIAQAEAVLQVEFAPELRSWLALCNGAKVGEGIEIYGIKSIVESWHFWWMRAGIIPIANDGCGNPYVLMLSETRPRPVLYLEVDCGDTAGCVMTSSLESFLSISAAVYVREGVWPRDQERLTALDPGIKRIKGMNMAWEEMDDEM